MSPFHQLLFSDTPPSDLVSSEKFSRPINGPPTELGRLRVLAQLVVLYRWETVDNEISVCFVETEL